MAPLSLWSVRRKLVTNFKGTQRILKEGRVGIKVQREKLQGGRAEEGGAKGNGILCLVVQDCNVQVVGLP